MLTDLAVAARQMERAFQPHESKPEYLRAVSFSHGEAAHISSSMGRFKGKMRLDDSLSTH